MDLKTVIDTLNQQWDCGSFNIMTHTEALDCGLDDLEPTDIVIYYDYCSDELSDDDTNKLSEWLYDDYNGGWGAIHAYLASQGYGPVNDNDGSGGGLYYGAANFRKV